MTLRVYSDLVRSSVSIESVIREYVSLERYGSYLRGASPFCAAGKDSLYVNVDTQQYKCVSTGSCGDVFGFVQKMHGCSYETAVRRIGETHGFKV